MKFIKSKLCKTFHILKMDKIKEQEVIKEFIFKNNYIYYLLIIVREKSKQIIELINNEEKLEQERENAKKLRDKLGSKYKNFTIYC